ncbi:MAG TPA: helix-turn-helix domain-containing protein [Bacteriovoracaceae bacterium]|nr:helix-turn-helix domain-containing protein [Bacteriovoracaceae bacterium]
MPENHEKKDPILNQECYANSGIETQESQAKLFENLIWGIDEVSRFTSYSKGTIYNLVSEGDIPYRKKRGRLWFIPSEVLKWLKGEL